MFPNRLRKDQEGSDIEKIRKLGKALAEAEAVIIGAGAGLSCFRRICLYRRAVPGLFFGF